MRTTNISLILLTLHIFVPPNFNNDETPRFKKIAELASKILLWRSVVILEYIDIPVRRAVRSSTTHICRTKQASNPACVMSPRSFLFFSLVASHDVLAIFRSFLWNRSTPFCDNSSLKYAGIYVRCGLEIAKESESLLQIWVHLCYHTERGTCTRGSR